MMTETSSEMDSVCSKTRSPTKIKGKPYEHPRGFIFYPVFMKLAWNDCHDDLLGEFETGSH